MRPEVPLNTTDTLDAIDALAGTWVIERDDRGSAFSERSPFADWYEDVRALGYLRPPWALAFDQLRTARQPWDPA